MKELKSKYVTIDSDKKIATLHDKKPIHSNWLTVLQDCDIQIEEGELTVTGYKWEWGFNFERVWLSDLKETPEDKYLKFGYRSMKDFFNRIKKPYVKAGWYKLENKKYYK